MVELYSSMTQCGGDNVYTLICQHTQYTSLISNIQYMINIYFFHGRMGHWTVYYTSHQSLLIMFLICWLNKFGVLYWILISWFIILGVQTFQILIEIYWRGNFVYDHWGCTFYNNLSAIVLSLLIPAFLLSVL